MSLFSRFKKNSSSSEASTTTAASEQFQADPGTAKRLMEELYKRNAELAVRNKTMALLRRLDEISLKVLEEEEMAKEMTSAISEEFGYDLAALSITNSLTGQLRWISMTSATPWITDAIKQINLQESKMPISENQELMKKVSAETSYLVENPNELYPETLVKALTEVADFYKTEPMKNSLVNALRFGNQLLGILILSSNRSLKNLSSYEHESIVAIVGLISLALYKAEIYKQLQDLTHNLQQKVDEQTVEVKQAYEVEKKARVELEELDKAKDQFIMTTQHHLRTPLTIIKGYVDFLSNRPPETTLAESKDVLSKTSVAADRLASLVNELLDISQTQVGKSLINKQQINIKKLIKEITDELSPGIEEKLLKTVINIPEDSVIEADFQKLKEALTNLIDNAVKYNQAGGSITIKGERTRHPIERDKEIYRLTIENTGIGLTPEELSQLFTQYFQRGKEAEKLYTTGRGIGLAVTKNIIQAHQGKIYAESGGRGQGARFVVELPVI